MLMARDTRGTVQSWNGIVPAERLSPMFGRFDEHGRPNPVDGEFGRGTRFQTTKPTAVPLEKGQVLRVHVACPGGYGDPLERDVQRVQRDVANERISLAQAQDVYGVVIDGDTLAVDEAATEAARRQIASDSRGRQFGEWPVTEDEFQQLTSRPVIGSHVAMEV
jgi:N-methylhydantoinase B